MKLQAIAGSLLVGCSLLAFGGAATAAPGVAKPAKAAAHSAGKPDKAAAAGVAKSAYVTPAVASLPLTFEVFLPLRNEAALDTLLAAQQNKASPQYHKWLTPTQFRSRFGPTTSSISKVSAALKAQGLTVSKVHTRSIEVTGTAGAVAKTFATTLSLVQPAKGPSRLVANDPLALPSVLKAEGAVIPSFGTRPPARQFHVNLGPVTPENRYGSDGAYWFDDLKQAYGYPSYQTVAGSGTLDGTGVSVAVLMSNDAQDSDIAAYFDHELFTQITGKPAPTIQHVPINGGAPFDVNASFEASLDVQQVLGGAPGASVSLINIPDLSDENIIAGYLNIVESNTYDVVNSSFGGCELFYSPAYNNGTDFNGILDTYDTLFKQGNAQGITFVASSGDSGALECPEPAYLLGTGSGSSKFVTGISFPADSPNVTAVGGGNLVTTDSSTAEGKKALKSSYVSENGNGDPEKPYDPYGLGSNVRGGYWGAGGGISAHFKAPSYQSLVKTGSKYRTVPDIGMQVGGCPGGISRQPCGPDRSAAVVADGVGGDGGFYGVIGTSVSSPEFVGAIALYEQGAGRQGNLNTFLYVKGASQTAHSSVSYHRPSEGFDGLYTAKQPSRNYNYIFGNGTPIVRDLFDMPTASPAGIPQTKSNP